MTQKQYEYLMKMIDSFGRAEEDFGDCQTIQNGQKVEKELAQIKEYLQLFLKEC